MDTAVDRHLSSLRSQCFPLSIIIVPSPTGRQTPTTALAARVKEAQKSHAFWPSHLVLQLAFPYSSDTVWQCCRGLHAASVLPPAFSTGSKTLVAVVTKKLQMCKWNGNPTPRDLNMLWTQISNLDHQRTIRDVIRAYKECTIPCCQQLLKKHQTQFYHFDTANRAVALTLI